MKLVETREMPKACVILSGEFANVGNWVFFSDEEDAKKFAEENDGRVVVQDGLAEKFESMLCAEGAARWPRAERGQGGGVQGGRAGRESPVPEQTEEAGGLGTE